MTEKQCPALAKEVGLDIVILPNPRREGVAAEFAGTLVRLLDDCCRHNFDLGQAFRDEMDYNWTRTHRHGGEEVVMGQHSKNRFREHSEEVPVPFSLNELL